MRPRTFVTRGLALVALASLGFTAACEDNTAPPVITPVTVTVVPPTLELAPGQTGQFAAAVAGGTANGDRTVTWASSAPSVVSVDQTGKVTVAANVTASTTVTITATSKQDASAVGAGAVNVTVTAPPPPAGTPTITIKDITTPGGGTVNAQNIAGPINVLMDVDVPQGAEVTRVEVLLDGNVVCTIPFTGTGAAKPGDATTESAETVQAICPINTAAADSAGTPSFANGPHTLSARLVGPSGTAASSIQQTIIFNNVDTVIPTITTSGASAPGPLGLVWRQGDLTVKLTPTLFSGGSIARVTVTVSAANGGATATMTDSTAADGFTVTFPQTKSLASNGVGGVQDSIIVNISTVTAAGQGGPTNSFGINQPNTLRLDNVAPSVSAITLPAPGSTGAIFINGAFTFAASGVTATDAGVDRVTFSFLAGADTASLKTVATGADLAEVSVPTYVLRVVAQDALGNDTIFYAGPGGTAVTTLAAAQRFGVDLTPPTITVVSGPANLSTFTDTTSAAPWVFALADTGATGIAGSGIGTNALQVSQVVKLPGSTVCFPSTCKVAAQTSTTVAPVNNVGYDSVTVYAVDIAGNQSSKVVRLILQDTQAPTMGGIVSPATIAGGTSVAFSTAVSDDIDLGTLTPTLDYQGTLQLEFEAQTLGTFGTDVFSTTATPSVTVNPFLAQLSFTDGTGALTGVSAQASAVTFSLTDVAGNAATPRTLDITPNVQGQTINWGATGIQTFTLAVADSPLCSDDSATPCTDPSSTTLSAAAVGPSGTFANPFTQVRFYFRTGTGAYQLLATATAASAVDVPGTPGTRTWTWQTTFDASGLTAGATYDVLAVGINSKGQGIVAGPQSVAINP